MADRRRFLAGMLASGLVPAASWADAGSPAYLTAARNADGRYVLLGLSESLHETFRQPLPARGHAAAAHPIKPQAVAFARRPGLFALVMDCRNGTVIKQLSAPDGRHFYGHGVFSRDGALLYTTENDYAHARGVVGVWDARNGYDRIDEFDSGGIGPHDITWADAETLVVANGGIETHPDSGRTKLNLPTMQPNLSYIRDDIVADQAELPAVLRKNSIRHLSVRGDGLVAFAMQWQGDEGEGVPLAGLHSTGSPPTLLNTTVANWRDMNGYAGSISFSLDGKQVGITSPRGGRFLVFDTDTGELANAVDQVDVCGVAQSVTGFVTTTGEGEIAINGQREISYSGLSFDNHLVRIRPV